MKNISLVVSVLFLFTSCISPVKDEPRTYVVETVNTFTGKKQSKMVESKRALTALEALQYIATVETQVKGKYVLVSAIDTFKNICCKKAWYYKVNGQSPNVLAINNVILSNDTITWIYKEDVCSVNKSECKKVARKHLVQ